MAAWVTPVSVLRLPARLELWSWTAKSIPVSFARNSAISTPYAETSPMIALRDHPVPKTQLDPSIFEVTEEDEYRYITESFKRSLTTPVATNSSGFSSSSLLQLVRQRDYITASRVRTEMILHQIPITPDHTFIWPALHVANSPIDPAVKLKEFCAWFSLLPVADKETTGRPMFGRLMHALSNPHPDTELIMAFVRICVSKGYMVKIPDKMITLVVRFAPPSTSLQILEDLRSSIVENFTNDKQMRRKFRFWCKVAIVEYLGVGLVEEATKVLRMGLQHGPTLPRVPSRWLGKAVAGRFELPDLVIPKRPKVRLPRCRKPSFFPGLIPDIPSTLNPLDSGTDLHGPRALLWRVLENVRSVKPPDPLDIARFLEIFDSQPTIIWLLSAHNQRKPAQYREQWILGEMLYYARRKEWEELIEVFDTHFFNVGVPANIDDHKSRGRITTSNVKERLFPSSYHTSLVWMAAVEIRPRVRPLVMLFEELVERVETSKSRKYTQVGPSLVSPPTAIFDASHFTPFIVSAYRERRFKHLVAVVGEMSRLGIEPRVEQLSLLAGAYAGMRKGSEAVHTLDRMEGALQEEWGSRSWKSPHGLPRDVALYIPALRRFIRVKDALGASLVERRILGRGYVRGTSPDVDRMLAMFAAAS